MRAFHCSWALALLLTIAAAAQQAPAAPATAPPTAPPTAPATAPATAPPTPTGYTIFMRGTPIGREDMSLETTATGTTVVSSGRLSAPLNVVLRRAEFKYRPDGTPELVFLDVSSGGADATLRTTFVNGSAATQISQGGQTTNITHQVAAQSFPLPNNVFAAYAAIAQRLASATVGSELRAYVLPSTEVGVRVASIAAERMQIGATFVNVRRYELSVANPGGDLVVSLTADERGSLLRVGVAAAGVDVIREDLAASTSRVQLHSNPGDEPVIIPAVGFNLGATLTRPRSSGPPGGGPSGPPTAPIVRLPAIVLLAGAGAADRDGFVAGISTLGQLAGAVADAGFIAVRYDKRGFGQSGGRSESATLQDYSDDARAVVKWLLSRKDVDPKRIAVIGHSEGAWVAIQAAARDSKIAALVSIAAPATAGTDVILEQQLQALDVLKLPAGEREQRIALQKRIQAAVLTGKGWDGIPPELRKQADTPWLQSFLAFTPATVVDDVRQPILFVHGELDRQVPVTHVTQLSELAREGRSRSIEVVVVRGVNHLLVPAITGEIGEYASLPDRTVSADIRSTVTGWLTRTFAAIK